MKVDMTDVLDRITLILKSKNQTKKEFCEAVKINYQSLQDWKNRNTIPAGDICIRIATYLGVSVEYLLTGKSKFPDDIAVICSLLMSIDEKNRKPIVTMIKSLYEFYNPKK